MSIDVLYANLCPPSESSNDTTHSYARVRNDLKEKRKSFEEEFRQNIYVNIPSLEEINSPIYMNLSQGDPPIEENSSQTIDQEEVNMIPSCRDKSELYRQKMPLTIAPMCPILINTRPRRPTRKHRRPRYPVHIRTRPRRITTTMKTRRTAVVPDEQISSKRLPLSISENVPIDQQQDETSDEDFFVHETFEDFLFRRPSSYSSVSSPSPPIPPPSPPRTRATISKRYARGMTLGLEQSDVNFIHTLIQRTAQDRQTCNRITALREAYRRATNKQMDSTRPIPMTIVHPSISRKIHDELEKYDQLPFYFNDDDEGDDDDEIYEMNEPYPSKVNRLKNFLSIIKRRAQENFQQLKKNFHAFRTRLIMENIPSPSHHRHRHHHTTDLRRMHRSQVKTSPHRHHHTLHCRSTRLPYAR